MSKIANMLNMVKVLEDGKIHTIQDLADVLEVSVDELLQAKKKEYSNTKLKDLINLIFKAIAVAMGVAVIVLNVLNKIDIKSSVIMLGIGILCIGIYLLDEK